MTDHTTPPTGPSGPHDGPATSGDAAIDEVASAYLDAMASPAEIARVEADDSLIDVVGRFASVERAVDDVPPPPPGVLEAALSAALDVFDTELAPSGLADSPDDAGPGIPAGAAGGAVVTSIVSHRRVWWTRVPLGAVAAVVVVIALIGVAGLIGDGTSSDDTAATATGEAERTFETEAMDAAESSDDVSTQMADAAAESPTPADISAAGGESTAAPAGSEPRLRVFDSEDQLLDQYRQRYGSGAGGDIAADDSDGDSPGAGDDGAAGLDQSTLGDEDAGAVDPCDSVRVLGFDDGRVVTVERVSVDGRNATAVVASTDDDDDSLRLGVVADDGCSIILLTEL